MTIMILNSLFHTVDSGLLAVIPLVVYANADLQREYILIENKGKLGVYRWVNKTNGKTYVGSSVNLSRRFAEYYRKSYISDTSRNMAIHIALLKYGYYNFQLEILEYCDTSLLLVREQFYLDLLQPEYNILQTAGSSLGYLHSEESKRKMREAPNPGRFTKGQKHSEETKRKMSEARLGSNRPAGSGRPSQNVEVFDKETNLTATFDSFSAAATALDIRYEAIKNYFSKNQQKPYKGRYVFTKI